jgi:peptide/nickel transport system substrate-binding protein
MNRRTGLIALALATGIFTMPALAQKSADTIRIVLRDAVTNVDPYYNQLRTGVVLSHHAWDGLVYRDPDTFQSKPLLATSWKLVDDKTIDFELRRGVKFHNGDDFTADDVVYTLNLVSSPDSKVSTPANVSWIAKAEKLGDHSVRLHMKAPHPAALEYLSFVMPIYPKAYRERVGPDGYAKAPVGAGPYRITKVEAGQIDFERFDGYYADSPRGKAAIAKLVVRFVPDAATEMTELLAGRADFIWNFNPDQFDAVNRMPNLQAMSQESMRVGYVQMDAAGRSGAGNPLTNVKVRQAISHAINRQEFADKLVQRGSRVPNAPCYPTQFGCDQEIGQRYPYDPAKARALLAEAGFPNGFETEMVTYVLPTWAASIQSYLQAVGIRAKITHMQVQAVVQRNQRGESPMNLGSWGSFSINDVSAILPNYFAHGLDDYARDPRLKELLERGGSTMDQAARKTAYSEAVKIVMENSYWIPINTYVTTYGLNKQLDFKTFPDEMPRFWLTKWK